MRFLAVLMLIAFLNNPSNSLLSPLPPSPWFIEHIALEPLDLPSGVDIALVTRDSGNLPNEYIVFKNNSPTTLYVAGTPDNGDPTFDTISVKFPPGIGPIYKVVDGQAYIWRIKYNHPESGYYYSWFKENQRDDSIWLYVIDNQLRCETGMILELEPRNQYDGDRPKDVKIPEPQEVILPIIYGTDEIQIPLTVFYTLNDDYRPYQPNWLPDSLGPEMISCFLLACFIIFVVIALLVDKSIRGRIDKQDQKEKNA